MVESSKLPASSPFYLPVELYDDVYLTLRRMHDDHLANAAPDEQVMYLRYEHYAHVVMTHPDYEAYKASRAIVELTEALVDAIEAQQALSGKKTRHQLPAPEGTTPQTDLSATGTYPLTEIRGLGTTKKSAAKPKKSTTSNEPRRRLALSEPDRRLVRRVTDKRGKVQRRRTSLRALLAANNNQPVILLNAAAQRGAYQRFRDLRSRQITFRLNLEAGQQEEE